MKKILGLTVAALMVMGLVGGGTWAFFSDTETSTGNTFIAGTLDLGLSNTSNTSATGSITGTFSSSNWAPGDNATGTLWINNDGSINISTLTITFNYGSVNTTGRPTTISGSPWSDDEDKFDKMVVAETVNWGGSTVASIQGKTLEELKAGTGGPYTLSGGLTAGTNKDLYILWRFDTAADNGCQGNTVEVTVTAAGIQN